MVMVAIGAVGVGVGAVVMIVVMSMIVAVVAARAVDVASRRERGSGRQGLACLSVAGATPSRCATVRPVRCLSKKSPS